jgi:hypothetical protein
MVTVVEVVTEAVVTGKLALVDPAGTVRLLGTVAALGWLLLSETVKPLAGAGAVNCTVPVTGFPPTICVGLRVSALSCGDAPAPTA